MKFCKDLERVKAMAPLEWDPFWPNYKLLKKLIKGLPHKRPSSCPPVQTTMDKSHFSQSRVPVKHDSSSPASNLDPAQEALLLKHDRNECVFFKLLYAEMNKATHFFEQTQLEYQLRMGQLQELLDDTDAGNKLHGEQRQAWAHHILILHQDLLRLETFAIMTYCGLSKILKKHDKVTGFHTRNAFMANVVHPASITHTPQLHAMIQKCQDWLAQTVDLSPRRQRQPQAQLDEEEQLKPSERDQQLFWDTIQKLRTSSSPPPSLMSLLTLQEANQPYQNWKAAVSTFSTEILPHRRQISDVDSSATTTTNNTKKRTLSDLSEDTMEEQTQENYHSNCKQARVQLAL